MAFGEYAVLGRSFDQLFLVPVQGQGEHQQQSSTFLFQCECTQYENSISVGVKQ